MPDKSSSSDSETWSERSASPPYDPSEAIAYVRTSSRRTSALGTDITDEIYGVSESPVGYGGSADVYHGMWDSQYGPMRVALKVLRIIDPKDRRTLRHFRREISVWRKLFHPHIHLMCGLYTGFGSVPAMVSPWYDSGDINRYVRKRASDPEIADIRLSLLVQVMHGLEYLHGKLIVHGDIKGGNVLVSDDGVARLSDFGLSAVLYRQHSARSFEVEIAGRNVSLPSTLSHHSYIKGTCRWMAPELLLEDVPRQTFASDIWACGCLFIEVNSGIHPYHTKDNDIQVIVALADNEAPPRPEALSPIIYSLSLRCCRSQPSSRLSVQAITQQLQEAAILTSIVPGQLSTAVLLPASEDVDTSIHQESWSDFGRHCLACYQATERALSSVTVSRAMEQDYFHLESLVSVTEMGRLILNSIARRCMSQTSSWTMEQALESLISPCPMRPSSGALGTSSAVLKARIAIAAGPSSKLQYPPEMLRSIARTIARKDEHLAEELMINFSTPQLYFLLRDRAFSVLSVAFLSDSRRVILSSHDGTLRIWDMKTDSTPIGPFGEYSSVRCVAVHGSRIASCYSGGTFCVWAAGSGALVFGPIAAHAGRDVNCIAYSKDGTHIATAGHNNCASIWDAYTGVLWRGFIRHTAPVMSVAFSEDGTRLVSGSQDSTVRIWDVVSGRCIGELLMGHASWVTAVRFTHDDQRVCSSSNDGTVRIWDVKTGAALRDFQISSTSIALSPDGKRLVSGSLTGRITMWDAETGATIPTACKTHESEVVCLAFSPDGRKIVSTSEDKTIAVWDATDDWKRFDLDDNVMTFLNTLKSRKAQLLTNEDLEALSFLSGSGYGLTLLREVQDELKLPDYKPIALRLLSCLSVQLTRGGLASTFASAIDVASTVITTIEALQVRLPPSELRSIARALAAYDDSLSDAMMVKLSSPELRPSLRGHTEALSYVAFFPDGRRLVSSSQDGTLRIWDVKTGETPIGPLAGHTSNVSCVAVQESRIASCSYDGTFCVWSADSGALVLGPIRAHTGRDVHCIAYSRDGTHIATAGDDKCAAIWDAYTGVECRRFTGHTAPAMSVAFSEDGKRLVSGSQDKTVRIWDVASGECTGEPLKGHTGWVTAVCFSPDAKRIFSSSADETIRTWDAETRTLVMDPLQMDHQILCMALSPDGRRLVSGSLTGRIAMWDAETGAAVATSFTDHEDKVWGLAFSQDGRMIASASRDKTIALWDATDDWKRFDVEPKM